MRSCAGAVGGSRKPGYLFEYRKFFVADGDLIIIEALPRLELFKIHQFPDYSL